MYRSNKIGDTHDIKKYRKKESNKLSLKRSGQTQFSEHNLSFEILVVLQGFLLNCFNNFLI